jgi:cob(I)alamin adenosyltransferase
MLDRADPGVPARATCPAQDTGHHLSSLYAPVASGLVKPRIYTKTGDDGTTGLYYGGRIGKNSAPIEINGVVDEAQAAIGLARAETPPGSEVNRRLAALARDLYVLMAEVATAPENRHKLKAGTSLVTEGMVAQLESGIDDLNDRFEMPSDFIIPGHSRCVAALDLARTIVRRAERLAVAHPVEGSLVTVYLNRLSDLLWAMARWQEGPDHTLSKDESS